MTRTRNPWTTKLTETGREAITGALTAYHHAGGSFVALATAVLVWVDSLKTDGRPNLAAPCLCPDSRFSEARMSDCRYGCKVYRCATHGTERVLHNAMYGCRDNGR